MIGRWQRPALLPWKRILYQRPGIAVSLRYMSEGQSQPKKNLPQLNTRKATRDLWEFLDPRWKKVMNQLKDARSVMRRYASQFQYHASKARMSIMEANKKLAEQEQERADQRLTYDKDVATSETIKDLPSQREIHRRKWARKLEFYLDSLQETIFTATRALNDVTGYSSIQRLRKSIELMETNMEQTRENLKALKEKYATAIENRIQSQKQLNELLQRKSTWAPADLERFTQIYKDDALNQKKEQTLKGEVSAEEEQQEKLGDDLYRAILTRYHEEQIWSDKIRRTSTWGTFILMGVNIILFLVFQLLLEPWKRRRLTRSFEGKVKKALDDYAAQREVKLEQLITSITPSVAVPTAVSEEFTAPRLGNLAGTELDHQAFEPFPEQITDPSLEKDEISKDKLLIRKLRKLQLWFRDFFYKFRPSAISDAHSQTLLSNIELYVYSTLLLLFGALSTKLMP